MRDCAADALQRVLVLAICLGFLGACAQPAPPPPPPPTDQVEIGRQLFFNETFDGNGRTCGACHREEDNFTITPNFIATLPPDDPLFVAETNPALARGFENPRALREFGLITENLDGFEDLEHKFTLRGVPHTLAQRTSIDSADGPHTGWSGDGAPGDRTLRSFAIGAVIQHFPKTLNRVVGVDFRLPTEQELDALEAFMLSLGRQEELQLPLPLRDRIAALGQSIFLDNSLGKCNICHFNAGANANPDFFPQGGNMNFDTGVETLPGLPARLIDPDTPADDGFGIPGDGTFNTPPLVEAADTGPFFHNNAAATIEGAVDFYDGEAFNDSPAGKAIEAATGSPIVLEGNQVQAIASFLRAINALENIRQSLAYLDRTTNADGAAAARFIALAREETQDAATVLSGANVSPDAVVDLRAAEALLVPPGAKSAQWRERVAQARAALQRANAKMLTSP